MPDIIKKTDRDHSEDFKLENGKYEHICYRCKQKFYGHKRRIICKKCKDEIAKKHA